MENDLELALHYTLRELESYRKNAESLKSSGSDPKELEAFLGNILFYGERVNKLAKAARLINKLRTY